MRLLLNQLLGNPSERCGLVSFSPEKAGRVAAPCRSGAGAISTTRKPVFAAKLFQKVQAGHNNRGYAKRRNTNGPGKSI